MEILFALLEILLEAVLETALEAAGEAIFVFLLTAIAEALLPDDRPVLSAVGYFLLGAGAGGLSLIWFPSPLVHPSRFHGISLILSPLLTGLLMALLGTILRKHNKRTVNLESFGYGYVFAFGMALVRFIFTR